MKIIPDFVSRLQEMLLDPEEPYVVAVYNGVHEISGNASGSREPYVVAVHNGEHEIRNNGKHELSGNVSRSRETLRRCCAQW